MYTSVAPMSPHTLQPGMLGTQRRDRELLDADRFRALRRVALDQSTVSGLTHRFYHYPSRFSPTFAAGAIELFSRPGDLVLDPYMGGGTTVVEALVHGRRTVGCDLNSLGVFVTRVKTTRLTGTERAALRLWAEQVVPELSYGLTPGDLSRFVDVRQTRNLELPRARPIKKTMALALRGLTTLPTKAAQDFARCALLSTGQWALNGRRRSTPLIEFRSQLRQTVHEMLDGILDFEERYRWHSPVYSPALINDTAATLRVHEPFVGGEKADLVVTSPPYVGIHVLYHRWQVDGRRETPAPYWIANCQDGRGGAFYNFADRREHTGDVYFAESLWTLEAVHSVMKRGAVIIQLVAFSNPRRQLPRYLATMSEAGFFELHAGARPKRIWRSVPGRRWHAGLKGKTPASREVVLIHRAV
jgi:hypothetical protein